MGSRDGKTYRFKFKCLLNAPTRKRKIKKGGQMVTLN
jgi:hypothetical protein